MTTPTPLDRASSALASAERALSLAAELVADEVAAGREVPAHMVATYRKHRAAVRYAHAVLVGELGAAS